MYTAAKEEEGKLQKLFFFPDFFAALPHVQLFIPPFFEIIVPLCSFLLLLQKT